MLAHYDRIGGGYVQRRQPDPRIAGALLAALGDARSVVNVGAGTGSYEPADRAVVAVEPSQVMIDQRPPGSAPCIQGSAETLPFEDGEFDAAMAVLTLHHWSDLEQGLRALGRVARRRVVILTWVPDAEPFWLTRDYFPEIEAHDRTVFPNAEQLVTLLERTIGPAELHPLPVPHDCVDGFLCAFWRRPEAYLDPNIRAGMSSFSYIDAAQGLARLADDLESGRWTSTNQAILNREIMDLGYRIAICKRA